MLERFFRLPIETPKPIIWIVALLTLIATPALLNVEFATDVQAFLPQSEEVETYDKITDNFRGNIWCKTAPQLLINHRNIFSCL